VSHELVAVLLGALAGTLSAMFGVGGGVVFVPTLIFLGHSTHTAVATSLVAIVPVVAMGAWRQSAYGSVRWRDAVIVGAASLPTAKLGEVVATSLPNSVLRRLFAVVLVLVAIQLVYHALRGQPE